MKRNIYRIFMGLLVLSSIISCSEEQGTEVGNDSEPSVIVYQYTPGEDYNADNDIKLRIAANNRTQEAYYLYELTEDKEKYIATNGEAAYLEHVVTDGIKLDDISGESTQDVVLTGLIGDYTITAVAVNGNQKKAFETTFYGIQWNILGEGMFQSTFFGEVFPVEIRKAAHAEWYKIVEPYALGLDLIVKFNGTDATIEQQQVFTDSNSGAVYAEGIGVLNNGLIYMNIEFTCAAGTFGEYTEVAKLPVE